MPNSDISVLTLRFVIDCLPTAVRRQEHDLRDVDGIHTIVTGQISNLTCIVGNMSTP